MWDTINKMKGKKSKAKISLKTKERGIMDDSEVANSFADCFKGMSANDNMDKTFLKNRLKTIETFISDSPKNALILTDKLIQDSSLVNLPFTLSELKDVLKRVNTKSSPGYDGIPFSFFKNSPEIVLIFLQNMINSSFVTNVIPKSWKTATIKPILKPGKDKNDIKSYRPISLTTTCSKITEKLIVARLSWYLEKHNLINPSQAGFRKSFSTNDPIIRLKHEAEFAVNTGNITVAILIDFTRAFDLLWIDGLLLKIRSLGISGNMFKWIGNFLTNRVNIVKIGECMSMSYSPENGTPQGSSISPLLFLIMVNDFPKLSKFTSDAFLADDCTIWRSGNNLKQIIFHLQQDLGAIFEWCIKWGFQMNTDKTVGIVFTNKKINTDAITIKIDNRTILFKNSCKLLGVVFDSHLTWKQHVDSLLQRATRGLNLMRCISGTSWGSNKDTLLLIYKSVILSNFDYCCFTYANSSLSNCKRLDSVQYKALLLATGGMKGTSLKALLGECAELPLKFRRLKCNIKYFLKIFKNLKNSAHSFMSDKKFYQLELNCKSDYALLLNNFLVDMKITLANTEDHFKNHPCFDLGDMVDLSFINVSSYLKQEDPDKWLSSIENILTNVTYAWKHVIFVDGSVSADGKVGAAAYSPSIPIRLQFKLPDNLSIYFAEAYAILQTLIYASNSNFLNICIISDSARVLQDIQRSSFDTSPHPNLIQSIINCISSFPTNGILLKWLPGHCGFQSSDIADNLAKTASNGFIFQPITYSKHEAGLLVDKWIWMKWQAEWEKESTCEYQKYFKLTRAYRKPNNSRRKDITLNRLRLMQCQLNAGLHKIGKHTTGLCLYCGVAQTNVHFLLNCTNTNDLRNEIKKATKVLQPLWTYENLLNDHLIAEIIVHYIQMNNVEI